jgi:carbonic anhydrase/acetyltransferase-like protein (isoleucine patch superfamily)
MLGAGTLVPPGKKLASGFLYVGAPAKLVRPLTVTEKESLEYSSQQYIQLKNQYLKDL